jgi:hypothetical protein
MDDHFENHTPYRARQTAYLSFLSGATGFSTGTCGIFDWGKGTAQCPPGLPLRASMNRLTSRSMRYLRYILQTVNWQRLRSESGRILNQPNIPEKNIVLAYDGSSAMVAYLPAEPASVRIDFGASGTLYRAVPGLSTLTSKQQFLHSGWVYRWFSPRSGNSSASPDVLYISPGKFEFTKPTTCDHDPVDVSCDQNDWVLRLTKAGGPQPPLPGFAA